MTLTCFRFAPNIIMFLSGDWFTRIDPPIQPALCKTEAFDFPAHPCRPDLIDDRLTAFLDGIPIAQGRKQDLAIAVSEIAMNAMQHDSQDVERTIRVHFLYIAPLFVLVGITDTLGTLPDAVLQSDPTVDAVMAKLPDHGRGIFISRQLTTMFGQVPSLDGTFKEIWVGIDLNLKEATSERSAHVLP